MKSHVETGLRGSRIQLCYTPSGKYYGVFACSNNNCPVGKYKLFDTVQQLIGDISVANSGLNIIVISSSYS